MAEVICNFTHLKHSICVGEEFQPRHPGVVWEKVIGCCLGLHAPCRCMWGDGSDSQKRICLQIHRHNWCICNPIPVWRRDQMRVSAWIVGLLLFAPWNRTDLINLIESGNVGPTVHRNIGNIMMNGLCIVAASNAFSAVPWSNHSIRIQQHV